MQARTRARQQAIQHLALVAQAMYTGSTSAYCLSTETTLFSPRKKTVRRPTRRP